MDYIIFKLINQHAGKHQMIDQMMIWLSKNVRYLFFLILIIYFFLGISRRRICYRALCSSGLATVISILIKCFYYKPRPFIYRSIGILIPCKMNSSFPSKHTYLMFAIATSFYLREKFIGLVLLMISTLTGLSRIWVGHHYPSDILGSVLIGSLSSIIVEKSDIG